jgi:hypothetical protein
MTPGPALARGHHSRLEGGVCVVELTSILAGAHFSDRPPGVSPTVAAFLRGYNDGLDDGLRQDLRPLAAELVRSAADARVEAARAERCRARLREIYGLRLTWLPAPRGPESWFEVSGYRAGRFASADAKGGRHYATLRLLSELLLLGRPTLAPARPEPALARA